MSVQFTLVVIITLIYLLKIARNQMYICNNIFEFYLSQLSSISATCEGHLVSIYLTPVINHFFHWFAINSSKWKQSLYACPHLRLV